MRRINGLCSIAAFVLVWCGSIASAQQPKLHESKTLGVGLEIRGMAWGMPRYLPEISPVPEQFRQIPGHKDDFSRPVTITVPGGTINPADTLLNLGISVAPQLVFKERVYLRGGVAWNYSPGAQARMDSSGNTREVNLRGTTARGSGESLVYYSIRPSLSAVPSPFAEVEPKVKRWDGVLGGYMLYRHNLTLERGWDRFNALEVLRSGV